jgi:hypothetical protein
VTSSSWTAAEVRSAYLEAARATAELLGRRELGDRWEEDSALAGFTIGGLAGHLARGVLTPYWYLDMPEPEPPVITASEYYAGLSGGDPESEQNQQVLARGAETAKGGWARLYLDVGRAADRLAERLADEPETHRIPAQGKALLVDEYLRTRVVELVVHLEDLTRSLGLPPYDLPDAGRLAVDVLLETAIVRHGVTGVLHALARRELDDVDALRVL